MSKFDTNSTRWIHPDYAASSENPPVEISKSCDLYTSNVREVISQVNGDGPGPGPGPEGWVFDHFYFSWRKKFRGPDALGENLTSGRAPTAPQGHPPMRAGDWPEPGQGPSTGMHKTDDFM